MSKQVSVIVANQFFYMGQLFVQVVKFLLSFLVFSILLAGVVLFYYLVSDVLRMKQNIIIFNADVANFEAKPHTGLSIYSTNLIFHRATNLFSQSFLQLSKLF